MENISGNEATINDKNKEKTKQIIRDFIFILFYHLFGGSSINKYTPQNSLFDE